MEILQHIAHHFGGFPQMAKALGIRRQAIYQWKKIPELRAHQIERLTGGIFTLQMMRPELFEGTTEEQHGTDASDIH
ncbi:MAG: helix-turn-helix domain-containing protein [Magnetococcales bacterium]|nr:helix-turn-helix domain-containing protein [Magnetococcales bacterium]